MKAITWHGRNDLRCERVPDARIEQPTDALVRITATGICGSDLHLMSGNMSGMQAGDIIGHEPMGIVEAVGSEVSRLKVGDRVVVPFTISCGHCWFCQRQLYSCCDETNPNAETAAKMMGQSPAGLLGYSHVLGGYAGGQAELLRVPHADVGPVKIQSDLSDEQVVFLSDIFPTGYMAAENADIEDGDTVMVFGCGPVGQFAIKSAWMMGAGRVVAVDNVPERLAMAKAHGNAETIDFSEHDPLEAINQMTAGRGADRVIEAVGAEAHGMTSLKAAADAVKETVLGAVGMNDNDGFALNKAILCTRKGGTLSVPGVYTGMVNNVPMAAVVNKSLTLRSGQTHVQRYLDPLLKKIEAGEIDPSFVITHTCDLDDAPDMYVKFRDKTDDCIKVVIKPN